MRIGLRKKGFGYRLIAWALGVEEMGADRLKEKRLWVLLTYCNSIVTSCVVRIGLRKKGFGYATTLSFVSM